MSAPTTLADVLALIDRVGDAMIERQDTSDYEALVRHLAIAVLGVPGALAEAVRRAWDSPILQPLVVTAACAYAAETAEVDAAMAADLQTDGD